jgi:hypothetical protein
MNIGLRPGWHGLHTIDQALGALPNGTRVVKTVMGGGGDTHPIGATGSVIGSLVADWAEDPGEYFYFVEWDDNPKVAVGVAGDKVARTEEPRLSRPAGVVHAALVVHHRGLHFRASVGKDRPQFRQAHLGAAPLDETLDVVADAAAAVAAGEDQGLVPGGGVVAEGDVGAGYIHVDHIHV